MQLTEDAIHNWGEAYIMRQYAALPDAVKAAARAAMVRHHQRGTDAREEAAQINKEFGLQYPPPRAAQRPRGDTNDPVSP